MYVHALVWSEITHISLMESAATAVVIATTACKRRAWPKRNTSTPSSPRHLHSPRMLENSNRHNISSHHITWEHPQGKRVIFNPFVDVLRHRKALILDAASMDDSKQVTVIQETYCEPLLQTPRVSQAPSTPPRMIRQKYRLKDIFFKPAAAAQQHVCGTPGYCTPRRNSTTTTDIVAV